MISPNIEKYLVWLDGHGLCWAGYVTTLVLVKNRFSDH